MYAEFVGLTSEATALIENFRKSPDETKSEILVRVLSPLVGSRKSTPSSRAAAEFLDIGQGVRLLIGEKPVLFLSKEAKTNGQPDGIAEVRKNGFYVDGRRIPPSHGSVIHPAMKLIQSRKGHRNGKGELISLSAFRQWHVLRNGKLVPLEELKDPTLARRRGRPETTLADLGLE